MTLAAKDLHVLCYFFNDIPKETREFKSYTGILLIKEYEEMTVHAYSIKFKLNLILIEIMAFHPCQNSSIGGSTVAMNFWLVLQSSNKLVKFRYQCPSVESILYCNKLAINPASLFSLKNISHMVTLVFFRKHITHGLGICIVF